MTIVTFLLATLALVWAWKADAENERLKGRMTRLEQRLENVE